MTKLNPILKKNLVLFSIFPLLIIAEIFSREGVLITLGLMFFLFQSGCNILIGLAFLLVDNDPKGKFYLISALFVFLLGFVLLILFLAFSRV